MCLVYTPEGIVLAIWILCYLSEVVVLEPSSTYLYLERRLLDIRTGAPDWTAGEDVEHAGDIIDRGRWVQFDRRLRVHGKEKPAVRNSYRTFE